MHKDVLQITKQNSLGRDMHSREHFPVRLL